MTQSELLQNKNIAFKGSLFLFQIKTPNVKNDIFPFFFAQKNLEPL